MALREHFFALFAVGVALGVFSAARFYMVSWLGERVTADLRNAVYAHVVRQSPEFFETTQTGEVLSRLTTDTTLVQTVVGSSLSMGLRNAVMGIGAMAMLVVTNPRRDDAGAGDPGAGRAAVAVLRPPRAQAVARQPGPHRRLERDRRRGAERDAGGAELPPGRRARPSASPPRPRRAFATAVRRTRMRSLLVAFIISATFGALLWGLYQGTQAVVRGDISAGHLGQTVVYVIILVGSVAVLSEVYGDLLRAAGATERLIELLAAAIADRLAGAAARCSRRGGGAAVRFEDVTLPLSVAAAAPDAGALRPRRSRPARRSPWSGRAAPARARCSSCCCASTTSRPAPSASTACGCAGVELDALRERIGIVPQDSVIFSADAMENIRYGRPDASDDEVVAAATAAFAHDFISACPTATAPSSASAACVCRAASASASASPARC